MNQIILPISNLNIESVKNILAKNGLTNLFLMQNGELQVQKSDTIKVAIRTFPNKISIKTKFPTIGNAVQIVMTIVFIALFIGINENTSVRIPFPMLTGIALGQVVAYLWFLPKIKSLQKEIETILSNEFDK